MSVHTTADGKISAMRASVQAALLAVTDAVQSICIDEDWGADEYNDEFKSKLMDAQRRLYVLRAELAG